MSHNRTGTLFVVVVFEHLSLVFSLNTQERVSLHRISVNHAIWLALEPHPPFRQYDGPKGRTGAMPLLCDLAFVNRGGVIGRRSHECYVLQKHRIETKLQKISMATAA
jgi:hypothetical protein